MKFCSRCLMIETRPRISFDAEGLCNACQWALAKKSDVDWGARWKELDALVKKYKTRNHDKFDSILPTSGGKDSSYVAYQVKESLGMNPLMVTLHPPLAYEIGTRNLEESIKKGFDHIRISPNYEVDRVLARKYFIEQGQPLMAWMMSVQTAIFRAAVIFDIPFVMFGEEGETEYGGSKRLQNKATYDIDDSIKLYLSGNTPNMSLKNLGLRIKKYFGGHILRRSSLGAWIRLLPIGHILRIGIRIEIMWWQKRKWGFLRHLTGLSGHIIILHRQIQSSTIYMFI